MRKLTHIREISILFLGILGSLLMNCRSQESPDKVLIIQDELPQIEVLAPYLQQEGALEVTVVDQAALPDNFAIYKAIVLFIHGELERQTETRVIQYTREGGRLVVLHHSISSGKAENPYYFDFLGIHLSDPGNSSGPVAAGRRLWLEASGIGWGRCNSDANQP